MNRYRISERRGTRAWEVDVWLDMPDGTLFRERVRSPVLGKAASIRWAQSRITSIMRSNLIPVLGSTRLGEISSRDIERLVRRMHWLSGVEARVGGELAADPGFIRTELHVAWHWAFGDRELFATSVHEDMLVAEWVRAWQAWVRAASPNARSIPRRSPF